MTLDDWPPFRDLGLLQGAKCLGVLLIARENLLSEIGETCAQACIGQGCHGRSVELGDDVLRRALRHPKTMPLRHVKAGQPCLVDRRDFGRGGEPGGGGDRVRFHPARAHLRESRGRVEHRHVDLPGDQILQDRGTATIGHEAEAGAGFFLQKNAADVVRAADAANTLGYLVRIGLQPSDEPLEVVGRHGVLGQEQIRSSSKQGHGLEICQQIIVERIDRAARDMRRVLAQAERVTVGRCAGDATNRNGAACACHVLDDDRLTEKRLHPLGEIARDYVGRTSRGIRHNDGNRPRRIGLRPCDA
jgi:hypothetical protein